MRVRLPGAGCGVPVAECRVPGAGSESRCRLREGRKRGKGGIRVREGTKSKNEKKRERTRKNEKELERTRKDEKERERTRKNKNERERTREKIIKNEKE